MHDFLIVITGLLLGLSAATMQELSETNRHLRNALDGKERIMAENKALTEYINNLNDKIEE